MPQKSESDRIWAGDKPDQLIAAARLRYTNGSERELLPYASTLYSFREHANNRKELCELRQDLMRYADDIILPKNDSYYGTWWADRADMLSTYLLYIAQQPDVTGDAREYMRAKVMAICALALMGLHGSVLPTSGPKAHTYHLLTLTYVSVLGPGASSRRLLANILKAKPSRIPDTRQRARVYAKLGMLLRRERGPDRVMYWLRGIGWGIRALFVPKIPLRSRAKAAYALLGRER